MRKTGLRAALVLTLGLAISVYSENVPVLVWSDQELQQTGYRSNPLDSTSAEEFGSQLRAKLESKPFFVAFIEETLSPEDLSHRQDGETVLPYLQSNLPKSVYLPSVHNPVAAINSVAEAEVTDRVKLRESGLSGDAGADTRYLLVELSDARDDESRASLLRRHDDFMREMYAKLQRQYGNVVATYTGHYPSWSVVEEPTRVRRHLMQAPVNATAATLQAYNISGNLLLVLKDITVTPNGGTPVTIDMPAGGPTLTVNDTGVDSMTLHIDATNYTVKLIITSDNGYWFLNEADVTSKLSAETEVLKSKGVFALVGFSYHCGRGATFSGPNSTFTLAIEDLQVQPFFNGGGEHFGGYFDCVGYMSAPIWSGLLVVLIMLVIFFYGVCSIMDLRTMDRFDDPKGKTITINAQSD